MHDGMHDGMHYGMHCGMHDGMHCGMHDGMHGPCDTEQSVKGHSILMECTMLSNACL